MLLCFLDFGFCFVFLVIIVQVLASLVKFIPKSFVLFGVIINQILMHETQVRSLTQKDPLEEGTATHSSILAGKSYGQRGLEGSCLQGHQESDKLNRLSMHTQWVPGDFYIEDCVICKKG